MSQWTMVVMSEDNFKKLKNPKDIDKLSDGEWEAYHNPEYVPRVGDTYFMKSFSSEYRVMVVKWDFNKKMIFVALGF